MFLFMYQPKPGEWVVLESFEVENFPKTSSEYKAVALLISGDIQHVEYRAKRNDSLLFRDIRVIKSKDADQYNIVRWCANSLSNPRMYALT